jgi:hypothetical protein
MWPWIYVLIDILPNSTGRLCNSSDVSYALAEKRIQKGNNTEFLQNKHATWTVPEVAHTLKQKDLLITRYA